MRRFLVAGARALALFSAVLCQSAQDARPARAADLRDLDERVGELEQTVRRTSSRQLVRLPYNINDPQFAAALVEAFHALHGNGRQRRRAGGR